MKRKIAVIIVTVLTCLIGTQGAYPWGSLTHAYITGQIVPAGGDIRDHAIYGSTAPDFANYMFGSPYQVYLMDRTHTDFLRVWAMAQGGPAHALERAIAFGFVAHNEEDYTAHSMSLTLNPSEGYVVQKAAVLNSLLANAWEQLGLAGDEYSAVRAELSHELIEFAGDLFVALYVHPGTGQSLSDAATQIYAGFPELLTRAYAGNLVAYSNQIALPLIRPAALNILAGNELTFRGGMITYGTLLANPNSADLINNLALYLQGLAGLQGIQVDKPELVVQVLGAALYVIQDDFVPEISQTIQSVAERLVQKKVTY